MKSDATICRGEVVHRRVRPVDHKLRYNVFSLAVDVDRLEADAKRLNLFSLNRFNVFSINEKQHGHRNGTALKEFGWEQVEKAGFKDEVARIVVLFYPRIFGFAFNPLTVYFALDSDENPVLMIYEVRNTFGEDVTYILPAGAPHLGTYSHRMDKSFYVSPFNNVEGEYTFHVRTSDDELAVGVALKTEGTPLLRTHFKASARPLTDWELAKAFFGYPLMTLKVVAGIHWEAAILWFKGLRLKSRPEAPKARLLYGGKLHKLNV